MKRINAAKVFLVGAMVCGMAAGSSAEVVAYWPFGMNGLDDASGKGHTLVKSAAGVVLSNGVARLDGTQTKFSTALPLDLSSYTNLTVEFWMRSTAINPSLMIEHTENTGLNPGAFYVDYNPTTNFLGGISGGFRTGVGSGYNLDITAAGVASNGVWHHVALVYDVSKTADARNALYFDGVAQPTYTNFNNDAAVSFRNAYFYIGSRGNTGSYRFVGELDDIRISNAALATNDFLQTRSDSDARVVAYWPFNRGSELADASGQGNTLVNGSGVVFSNGVAVLNGAQTAFGTAASLDLTACSNLTVECFLRTTAGDGSSMVIEHSANATNNPGAFAVSRTGNTLAGGFRMEDGGNFDSSGTGTTLTNGAWHHVALIYDAASNGADRVRLYVDYVRQTPSDIYTNDVLGAFRNEVLYIGTRANNEQPFTGELDDLRIVDAALTTNQFLKAHTDGTPQIVAYWPFARGVEQADASGHNFALAMLVAGEVGFRDGSASFRGHSGLYTPVRFDLSGFKAVTIECFVRTVSTNAPLLLETSGNFNYIPGAFAVSTGMSSNDTMGAGYRTGDGYNIEYAPKGSLSDGAWHHVAYVIDLNAAGGTELTRLYLDGVRQYKHSTLKSAMATPFSSDQQLFVGWRGSSGDLSFIGEMDDIRLTGAALTTNEFLSMSARTTDNATNAVIAYWPFNTSNGLADASGNGRALTGGGVVFSNGVAVFGGAQTVKTASTLDLRPYSAITVEYFIRTTPQSVQIIMEQSVNFGLSRGAFVSYVAERSTGAITAGYSTSSGGFNLEVTPAGSASDDRWHHVGMVIDSSKSGADRVQLYFDYVRQPKYKNSASPYYDFNSATFTPFINDTVYIGSRNNGVFKFIGQLDDIRISGKALTPAEFLTRPTTVLPPVVAYWPFETGRELEDASGNGYSLTNSGVSFNASSGSAVFGGAHATFNTLKNLNLRWYDSLTLECFVKSAPAATIQMIMEISTNAALTQGTSYLSANANPGPADSVFTTAIYPYFGGKSYKYNQDLSVAGKALTDGKWHHLAFVIDSAKSGADRAKLYLDRAPQSASPANISDLAVNFFNATLYVGSRGNSEYKFTGEMDDVRISGAALTTEQFLQTRSSPQGTLLSLR